MEMSNVLKLSEAMMQKHIKVFPNCEWVEAHDVELAAENTPQYKCQSYCDDDGRLQNCTCGVCK